VTNLAFLAGLGGAAEGLSLIRFAGLAAVVAGSVSMFFGGILGARSELDLFHADSSERPSRSRTSGTRRYRSSRTCTWTKGSRRARLTW